MQSTVAALANLFASALVVIAVIIIFGTLIAVLSAVEAGGGFMVVVVLGLGLIALVICGASAVLVDIMNNVRNMYRTDGSGEQGSAIDPDEESDHKESTKSPITDTWGWH